MISRSWTTLCTALILSCLASPLRAEDKPLDDSYIAIKVTLGIAGSASLKSDSISIGGIAATADQAVKRSDDLEVSYGLAAQYMVPVHQYFVIGGLLGITSWQSSGSWTIKDRGNVDANRNIAVDIAAVPEGRIALMKNLELYLAVPVGLTIDWLNELDNSASVGGLAGAKVEGNTAVGFMISVLLGVRLAVANNFGFFTELGYIHRQFSHEVTGGVSVGTNGISAKANADIATGQFALNIGAYF
jgi:hypothetical protein